MEFSLSASLTGELAEHFRQRTADGVVLGEAPAFWGFAGRMFGGYSAAATLLGAASFAPENSAVLSANLVFISPCTVGPYRVETTDARVGRASSVVCAHLTQDGESRVALSAWFVRPDRLPPGSRHGSPVRPPAEPVPSWRDTKNAFDAAYARSVVNFPGDRPGFTTLEGDVELWIKLRDPWQMSSLLARQACDVMLADAHLAESVVESARADRSRSFSLDLSLRWWGTGEHDPAGDAWQLLRVGRQAGERVGLASASLLDASGRRRADVQQHVSIGPKRTGEDDG